MEATRIADELAIRRLLAVYCHYCDDGRFSELLALFAPGGCFVRGATTLAGHAALREYFEDRQGRPEQRGRHLTLNTVMEIHAGGAHALSDFVYLKFVDGRITPVIAGRYRDDFVQAEDGQWRFVVCKRNRPPIPAIHPPHLPGQHVRGALPVDGARQVRTYSISSAPERFERDGCIEITVKAVPGGRISPRLVRDTPPGSLLQIGLPAGDFTLPERGRPIVFITAGSGITPIIGMLRSLEARGALSGIAHLHYAPHAHDVILARELRRLTESHPRYRLHLVYTREPGSGRVGDRHFTPAKLDEICPDWPSRDCYACGPRDLLDEIEAHWRARDSIGRLHVERFHAPLATVPADAAGGRVHFSRSGVAVEADGSTSLLRVAEDAGIHAPHGCRMGICHSCIATLRAGCVRDVRNNRLIRDPGARVQVCVTAAAGNVEIDL